MFLSNQIKSNQIYKTHSNSWMTFWHVKNKERFHQIFVKNLDKNCHWNLFEWSRVIEAPYWWPHVERPFTCINRINSFVVTTSFARIYMFSENFTGRDQISSLTITTIHNPTPLNTTKGCIWLDKKILYLDNHSPLQFLKKANIWGDWLS